MTIAEAVDTTPHKKIDWKLIDWDEVENNVRRLQARIVKAQQKKEYRKVKDLQRFLTRSMSARLLAVRRVTTNKGRKTPGIDGITWTTPEQKVQAVHDLNKKSKVLPLRRIYISKRNGKKRPLSIPTMMDRAKQACHLLALDPIAETIADPHSYGFRPKRGAHDATKYIQCVYSRKGSAQYVLEADIKSCFDEINHEWIMENIPMDKSTLYSWLKAGFVEGKKPFPTTKGTPQGGIASPTIANITLNQLESVLKEKFGKTRRQQNHSKVRACRYADDFIVSCANEALLKEQVIPAIRQFLAERGLQLSKEKTSITHIKSGFDFLSQNTRRCGDKLLTTPSKTSVKRLKEMLRTTVKSHQGNAYILIKRINPIVKGWCNYHRTIASSRVFRKIDHYLHRLLWNWARKQHRNKSRRWIVKKYFQGADKK